jgi:ABC-2 type transport system ATP-binding protein
MSTWAIETENLHRTYSKPGTQGQSRGIHGIDLQVREGEVRGLLGPNGAGKTTLTKVLSTVLKPTHGHAAILGLDIVKQGALIREKIGVVLGGERGLYYHLTGRQNLEFWAGLYNVPRKSRRTKVNGLLSRLGLEAYADTQIVKYSRGMKQRLHLARGLVGDPQLIFLDEPTLGMDPVAAAGFRDLIVDLKSEGKTILMTTHDMAEAEFVCDKVALIDDGKLLAVETPDVLAGWISKHDRIDFSASSAVAEQIKCIPGIDSLIRTAADTYRLQVIDASAMSSILLTLVQAGVVKVQTSKPSLEEVYMHFIGNRGLKV